MLKQLLGPLTVEQFLNDHFLRLPFARSAGAEHVAALGSWEVVLRLLADPTADVLVGREGVPWAGEHRDLPNQAGELLEAGYTIGIRHAERNDAGLRGLADEFEREFLGSVDVHLYCTPTGHPGFGWHYDAEEVFILQTQGTKEWLLRKNTVNPWPLVETIPRNMQYEREIMPVMTCTLAAGHWLYIPAGYWHRTQAGERSISISVGVSSPTGIDVLDFLRPLLRESLRWRQRLPAEGVAAIESAPATEECQARFQELGQDVAQLLSDPQIIERFWEQRRSRFQRSE